MLLRLFTTVAHAWLEPAAALGPTVILGEGLGEEAPELVGVQRPEV